MIGRGRSGGLVAALVAAALVVPAASAPSSSGSATSRPAPPVDRASGQAAHAPPPPSLADLGPLLEGTWELESMTLPDGRVIAAPVASGVIVVDRGAYLAAAYVQPTPDRKVGSIFEGRLEVTGSTFRLVPTVGYRYDSGAELQVQPDVPPATKGTVRRESSGVTFEKEGGGTVTFPTGENKRVQVDADGTRIVHVRTSLTPRIPKDLPGSKDLARR